MATAKEDMPVSEARANITDVIQHVRLLRWTVLLTNRDRPVVGMIPVGLAKLIRRSGGADAVAQILAERLGVEVDGDEITE